MSDYIVHASGAGNQVRIFAASTRDLVEKAREIHNTSPVATAALGRLLTAGAMMGSMMKGEKDLLTLQIQCIGPIGGLTVTAKSDGTVKGYVYNPDVMLPPNSKGKLDVGGALDLGVLSVIKDMGMKEPYVGQTQLVSGEIAEDLTYYYATSEQINSSVALGVLMEKNNTVKQAGGFILQLMPFTEDAVIDALEQKIAQIASVTEMLEKGMTPEMILEEILGEMKLEINDTMPVAFRCDCSKERVAKALASLSKKDLDDLIKDEEPIEVKCHFCNDNYVFSPDDLREIRK